MRPRRRSIAKTTSEQGFHSWKPRERLRISKPRERLRISIPTPNIG